MPRRSRNFHRKFTVFAAALLLAALAVRPVLAANYDYTDIWYTPLEIGWGVNFTQSDNFIFATFFVYGPDKTPTWYTAQMTWDGSSQFTGGLYLTQGTYFGAPWNPKDSPPATQVGTASFTPSSSNNYQGTLTYTVTTVGTVTKPLQRLTLTPILLAANYVGGQSGGYSGCSASSSNAGYYDFFTLQVTQSGTNVSMTFNYQNDNPALTCTLAGTLTQNGLLYGVGNATYQCTDGLSTNASMSNVKATALGIEGQFSAPSVGGGCREDAQFSATLN
jgi:hypothetical protein